MSTAAATNSFKDCLSQNCSFKKDGALPLGLTLLPVVGAIINIIKSIGQKEKILGNLALGQTSEAAKNLRVSNKYKIMALVRDILVAVTLISLIALAIFNPVLGGFFAMAAALHLVYAGINAYRLHHNVKVIQQLESGALTIGSHVKVYP